MTFIYLRKIPRYGHLTFTPVVCSYSSPAGGGTVLGVSVILPPSSLQFHFTCQSYSRLYDWVISRTINQAIVSNLLVSSKRSNCLNQYVSQALAGVFSITTGFSC